MSIRIINNKQIGTKTYSLSSVRARTLSGIYVIQVHTQKPEEKIIIIMMVAVKNMYGNKINNKNKNNFYYLFTV